MSESDEPQITSISRARTLEEIADFWDNHSLADYWDQTHEVEFELHTKRRLPITLNRAEYAKGLTEAPSPDKL